MPKGLLVESSTTQDPITTQHKRNNLCHLRKCREIFSLAEKIQLLQTFGFTGKVQAMGTQ